MMSRMPSRGELEQRVMELLWTDDAPRTVSEVHQLLTTERELAYTTVMTVLDRLAKKGQVDRDLVSRAWQDRPRHGRAEVVADEVTALLAPLPAQVRRDTLRRLAAALTEEERGLLAAPTSSPSSTS